MFAVLETSNRHVDRVSVIVDPFRTTFVYITYSSGQLYRHRELPAGFTRGGMSMFVVLGVCGWYTDNVFVSVVLF